MTTAAELHVIISANFEPVRRAFDRLAEQLREVFERAGWRRLLYGAERSRSRRYRALMARRARFRARGIPAKARRRF